LPLVLTKKKSVTLFLVWRLKLLWTPMHHWWTQHHSQPNRSSFSLAARQSFVLLQR